MESNKALESPPDLERVPLVTFTSTADQWLARWISSPGGLK